MRAVVVHQEIEATLREIAVGELGIAPTEVEERVAALDSLERMQLAMAVEDHFHILLKATDEAELGSLGDLATLVAAKLATQNGSASSPGSSPEGSSRRP